MIVELHKNSKAEEGNGEDLEMLEQEVRKSGARVSKRPDDPKWHMWLVYTVCALCAPFMIVGALFAAIYDKITK